MIDLKMKGFVMIMVVAFLAVIILVAWAIVNIGTSEILQTRMRNDYAAAFYIAEAGAEKMYTMLKNQSVIKWPQSISRTYVALDGANFGYFSVSANTISQHEFCIASNGTVNGHTARAVVKYGYISDFTGGIPLASLGQMTLIGASNPAKLKIEGPAMSNQPTITQSGYTQVTNGTTPNAGLITPSFWCDADLNPKVVFDTNNDGQYCADTNGDGIVTWNEAIAQDKLAIFEADNAYTVDNGNTDETKNDKNKISDRDAFYYHYTVDLNNKYNLGIAPGQANYRSGNSQFDDDSRDSSKETIEPNVRMIFVDGNARIYKNDQDWQGSVTLNHTIVTMGDVSIEQPTNRPGDVLTIISGNDVYTTGTMGNQGGSIGDIIIYADNNFTAENGGKANASIFAKGTITIDTIGDDQGKDHRMLNKSTLDWTDPSKRPLGLPKDYAIISLAFTIENESTHKSVWQRN